MKAKPINIASRHPQVVMIFDQEEDIHGAVEILSAQFDQYRAIAMNAETTNFLMATKPAVVLFALKSVAKSIEYYAKLVEQSKLVHPHYSVVLCSNKESAVAFRCCMKGLFDNYFVHQPLYEKYRLVMIVHNGIARSSFGNKVNEFNEENFEEMDEKLVQLINEGSDCKKALLAKVEQSREDIIKVTENYQPQPEQQKLSPQELLAQVTQEHVKPLLSILENDIRSGIDNMITQMMEAQTSVKEQENKAKGLVTHVPFIKEKQRDNEAKNMETSLEDDSAAEALLAKNPLVKDAETNSQNRILVVEDNALYRDMLVNVLSKENFVIDEAEDGLCALKKIRQFDFDLIIMDLFMPKLDGLNVTKKIRQASGGKDIPVIALTGNKNKDLIRKWAAFGLKGYIIKPSTKEEILSSVSRVFSTDAVH